MPIAYVLDLATNTVKTRASGSITSGELLGYLEEVIGKAEIKPGFVEIVDFGHADDLIIKYTETQNFKRVWKRYMDKGCRATIIYAPTDVCYGISRMVQSVVESVEGYDPDSFHVVRTEDQLEAAVDTISRDRQSTEVRDS